MAVMYEGKMMLHEETSWSSSLNEHIPDGHPMKNPVAWLELLVLDITAEINFTADPSPAWTLKQ